MPRRNVLKIDVPNSYYHIYFRGVNKDTIFERSEDYKVFLNLLKRYLSVEPAKDKFFREYPHLRGKLELLAFCLMPNHVHMLVHQVEQGAMQQLMQGALSSYSKYFNKVHGRSGPLFESRYKASLISNQSYLEHISRYIHLNPKKWKIYEYSSLPYYIGNHKAEWLTPAKITALFDSKKDYLNFLEDYVDYKRALDEIRSELAAA